MAFEVTVAPTAVQGKDAPARVAAAISELQAEQLDLIVVVRGGGIEGRSGRIRPRAVARAIATSDIPVWTGIGHTGDQSVADEVANRSFITPTECGQELARLAIDYWRQVEDAGHALARMARDHVLRRPDRLLATRQRADGHRRPVPARPPRRRARSTGPAPCAASSGASSTATAADWPPGARP